MKFEKAGRTIDREVSRIVKVLEEQVGPQAQRGTAELLHKVADLLEELAERIEKTRAPKPRQRGKRAR